jgi:hypothetical protein
LPLRLKMGSEFNIVDDEKRELRMVGVLVSLLLPTQRSSEFKSDDVYIYKQRMW